MNTFNIFFSTQKNPTVNIKIIINLKIIMPCKSWSTSFSYECSYSFFLRSVGVRQESIILIVLLNDWNKYDSIFRKISLLYIALFNVMALYDWKGISHSGSIFGLI